MFGRGTRRDFLSQAGSLTAAGALVAGLPEQRASAATSKGPHDFVIVEGHRDMWEISGRTRLPGADNHMPITNHLVPRLIEAGITVCIAPAGGAIPWRSATATRTCSMATCAYSTCISRTSSTQKASPQ